MEAQGQAHMVLLFGVNHYVASAAVCFVCAISGQSMMFESCYKNKTFRDLCWNLVTRYLLTDPFPELLI